MKTRAVDATCLEEFLGLAHAIHRDDPRWVPPLRDVQARDLCGLGEFGKYAAVQMFLCEEAGRVVGRLAAIHNPRLPEMGQLGYLELIDDPRVLPSLLDAAVPWLKARGATALWGPMDGGVHRTHRVMTRGFETEPHFLEPRNAPYVPGLIEAAGFTRAHTWHGFDVPAPEVQAVCAKTKRIAKRARRRFDGSRLAPRDPATLPRLHTLLDAAWAGHIGYAPFGLEEFVEAYQGIVAIDCEVGVVWEQDGPDVGLALSFPDWVEQERALQGDAAGWGAWMSDAARPKRVIFHTIAFTEAARNTGAAFLVMEHAAEEVLPHYDEVIMALTTEDFPFWRRTFEPTREYALYTRPL